MIDYEIPLWDFLQKYKTDCEIQLLYCIVLDCNSYKAKHKKYCEIINL